MLKILLLALSLMTRIPLPKQDHIRGEDFARAAVLFPLAGLLFGVVLGVLALALPLLSSSSLLIAAILTVLWTAITGGLHLKGVASTADAWIGGIGDEEKTHKILNDQVIGDAGTTAIVILVHRICTGIWASIDVVTIPDDALCACRRHGQCCDDLFATGPGAVDSGRMPVICCYRLVKRTGLDVGWILVAATTGDKQVRGLHHRYRWSQR